jgi:predicted ABC-type transport system involved in lysophospholipase L1 biosynthesis ATPase subunit
MLDSVPLLSAVNLHKSYGKNAARVEVLRGLNLDVAEGEFVSVLGASGSGKSTMLHLLGTLDRPDKGKILLDGERIDNGPAQERDRLRNSTFGFIFQFYHLLPELNALENVLMPQMIAHSFWSWLAKGRALKKRGRELLERVVWGIAGGTVRANCPAAKCSAPPLPVPSSTSRASFWPTSRPATSTPPPALTSSPSSAT